MNGFIFLLWCRARQVAANLFTEILSILEVFLLINELITFPCFPFKAFWADSFADEWLLISASNVVPLPFRAPVPEEDFSTIFTRSPVVRFSSVPALKGYLFFLASFLVRDISEFTFVISSVVNANPWPNNIIKAS